MQRCPYLSQKRRGEEATMDVGGLGHNVFRLVVPISEDGGIKGLGEETIKKLCNETRACIKILNRELWCSERVVMVSAKEERDKPIPPAMDGILKVHKLLMDQAQAILDRPQGSDQVAEGRIPSQQAGGDIQSVITRMLLLGPCQTGVIIGKKGATIKYIRRKSGASVRVLDIYKRSDASGQVLDPGEGIPFACATKEDRVLEIRGEPAQVHKALHLFVSVLKTFWIDHKNLPNFESDIVSELTNQLPITGNYQHRMQIPLRYTDVVIGEGGEYIRYCRMESGAIINVEETRGVPGQITIEIRGSASQVHTAYQLIHDVISEPPAPAPTQPSAREA